jgi:hypothetical protein
MVRITDPALSPAWLKYNTRYFPLTMMLAGDLITVTNDPKRSWFAEVTRHADGSFLVK